MGNDTRFQVKNKQGIHAIASTDERITGRPDWPCLPSIQSCRASNESLVRGEKTKKAFQSLNSLSSCSVFLMDGISRHISWFDHLKGDENYATPLATNGECLASSYWVKKYLCRFSFVQAYLWPRLFLYRFKQTCPQVVELGMDTMVLENDEARKGQGVQPTYKKVQGSISC